jgi:N-acetylneuraminic acid mutarotase
VSWSDVYGNPWLFGGTGIDSTGTVGSLNDLWEFDFSLGSNGEWKWMGGSTTVGSNGGRSGIYGPVGTATSTNIPGGRQDAVSWTDSSGKFWLFGGYGYDSTGTLGWLNDPWEFDPSLGSNGEWKWMGGSTTVNQSGVYGTQGTAAFTNIPGGRQNAVSWTDSNDNLWLFGGVGYDSTRTQGPLNDLWKFDPKPGSNGEWTWMGGSSTGNQIGVYGTLVTTASTNIPGGRQNAVSWTDSSGKFWLFGGYGNDSTGTVRSLNDLWKFDPSLGSNGEWTWMGGSSTGNQSGVYGTLGTAASTNVPGARYGAVSWNGLLFGGYGYLNDLWEYSGLW